MIQQTYRISSREVIKKNIVSDEAVKKYIFEKYKISGDRILAIRRQPNKLTLVDVR